MSAGQATLYVVGSLLAGGAWIGIGVFGRRLWDRATNQTERRR